MRVCSCAHVLVWLEELVERRIQSQLQGLASVAGVSEHVFIHLYMVGCMYICMYVFSKRLITV